MRRSSRTGREQRRIKNFEGERSVCPVQADSSQQETVEANENIPDTIRYFQSHNVRKRPNPTSLFRIRSSDIFNGSKDQRMGVICRRVGRSWEGLLPRVDVGGMLELYPAEKVSSSARNPRFGNKAALLECLWFVVQEVDNGI